MLCPQCGQPIAPDQRCCSACGHEISAAASGAAARAAGAQPPSGALQSTVAPSTSRKAIASLVLGFFFWILPAAILAIVLGHMSRGEIERSNGRLKGTAMADAGFIMGGCGVAIGLLLIVSFIYAPRWRGIAPNEASAVGCLRTLNTAETTYRSMYPRVGFACSLSQMGPSSSGTQNSGAAGLIDSDLAGGIKNGYKFTVGTCNTKKGVTVDYQWLAAPLTPPSTSPRFFCTDGSGIIKYSTISVNACVTDGIPI